MLHVYSKSYYDIYRVNPHRNYENRNVMQKPIWNPHVGIPILPYIWQYLIYKLIINYNNIALSKLRSSHDALSFLRTCEVACHDLFNVECFMSLTH